MTPTLEEVKKVAIECKIALSHNDFNAPALQAFAQHWMKVQRESDAEVADTFYHHIRQYTTDVPDIGCAIRNNTGE